MCCSDPVCPDTAMKLTALHKYMYQTRMFLGSFACFELVLNLCMLKCHVQCSRNAPNVIETSDTHLYRILSSPPNGRGEVKDAHQTVSHSCLVRSKYFTKEHETSFDMLPDDTHKNPQTINQSSATSIIGRSIATHSSPSTSVVSRLSSCHSPSSSSAPTSLESGPVSKRAS